MRTQSHQRAGRFHEAGFYRDDAEFRSLIVPFAEEGVAAGQPVILGYDDRKADLLRSWLSDPAAVTFIADDSLSGSATQMLPNGNGPVWSYDNLHETITAKPESGPGNWNVTIRVGSDSNYHGFADPRMASEGSSDPGGILASQGTVTGSIRYDIQSDTPPDPSNVPATQPPGTGLGAVLGQLFDGNNTTVGGGHYLFNYANVGGTPYSQAG